MSQGELIEGLRNKVARIIDDNRRLREQNGWLNLSLKRAKEEQTASRQLIAELQRRVNVLELSASMGGGAQQKQAASARINRLMREVDRCIALINKQGECPTR